MATQENSRESSSESSESSESSSSSESASLQWGPFKFQNYFALSKGKRAKIHWQQTWRRLKQFLRKLNWVHSKPTEWKYTQNAHSIILNCEKFKIKFHMETGDYAFKFQITTDGFLREDWGGNVYTIKAYSSEAAWFASLKQHLRAFTLACQAATEKQYERTKRDAWLDRK